MSAEQPHRTPIVTDFRGEDIQSPDFLLPPNVGTESWNLYHKNRTILPRPGLMRLHSDAQDSGSKTDALLTDGDIQLAHIGQISRTAGGKSLYTIAYYSSATNIIYRTFELNNKTGYHAVANNNPQAVDNVNAPMNTCLLPGGLCEVHVGPYTIPRKMYRNSTSVYVTVLSPAVCDHSSMSVTVTGSTGSMTGYASYAVCFLNNDDGAEGDLPWTFLASNRVENSSAASGATSLLLDGIPSNSENRTTKMRVYRTKFSATTNAPLPYYLVAEVSAATSYTDTTLDSALTQQINLYRGAPPDNPTATWYWQNRLWMAAGNYIWFSDQEMPAAATGWLPVQSMFYQDNYLLIDKGDYDTVRAGVVLNKQQVLVMTENKVFTLTGQGATTYLLDLIHDGIGCVSGRTVARSKDYIYFLSQKGIMRVPIGGGPVEDLSVVTHRDLFSKMIYGDPDGTEITGSVLHSGEYWQEGRMYICSFFGSEPETIAGTPNTEFKQFYTVVYDEVTQQSYRWDIQGKGWLSVDDHTDYPGKRLLAVVGRVLCELRSDTNTDLVSYLDSVDSVTGDFVAATDEYATSYTAGASSQDTIVCSGASFDNGSDDLTGVPVTVVSADGETIQTRLVDEVTNTTILSVKPDWDTVPSAGDTVYLGGINAKWKSPWFSPPGDQSFEAMLNGMRVWVRGKTTDSNLYDVVISGDEKTAVTFRNIDTADKKWNKKVSGMRANEFQVEISQYRPDQSAEIQGWRLGFNVADPR